MSEYMLSQTGAVIQEALTKMAAVTVTADQINGGAAKAAALTHTAEELDAGVTKIESVTQTAAEMQVILDRCEKIASPEGAASGKVLTSDGSGGTSWETAAAPTKLSELENDVPYIKADGSVVMTGMVSAGNAATTSYTGFNTTRNAAPGVRGAGFFVNRDGTAKFVSRSGYVDPMAGSGGTDLASIVFDNSKIEYIVASQAEGGIAAGTYDIRHSGNAYTKAEVDALVSALNDAITALAARVTALEGA